MFKKVILISILIVFTNSCTRDDICSQNTPNTPKLVISFRDIINPLQTKEVVGLEIETDYENSIIVIPETSSDSIAIPLQTSTDTTKFRFKRRVNDSIFNIDKIMFVAQRSEVYVNRACSYKTIYENLNATLESDGDNWILSLDILNNTVENENEAHITILH